jgi:hypothetical protein
VQVPDGGLLGIGHCGDAKDLRLGEELGTRAALNLQVE